MDIKHNTFPGAQASQQPWPFDRRPINGKYLFKIVGWELGSGLNVGLINQAKWQMAVRVHGL